MWVTYDVMLYDIPLNITNTTERFFFKYPFSSIHCLIQLKPSFHMSGKSQTIGDFTVFLPSQTYPTNGNRRHPQSSGMVAGKSGVFLFSRRVPDSYDGRRSFPTYENSNFYCRSLGIFTNL